MPKSKPKFKKRPKTKFSESNKKIKRPQIKMYAKILFDYERKLKTADKESLHEIKIKIEETVDEICRCYEPQAMYYIDEEIMKMSRIELPILTK